MMMGDIDHDLLFGCLPPQLTGEGAGKEEGKRE